MSTLKPLMKPLCIRLSAVLIPLGISSLQATTVFDNFDDGNDTLPPWTFVDPSQGAGSKDFGPDNKHYRLSGPAVASVRSDFIMSDGEVRSDITAWNPSVSVGSSVGIVARFDPTTLSGYFLSIDADGTPNLNLVKLVNGAPVDGDGGPTKTLNAGSTYILQLVMNGAELTSRLYAKGSPNTLVDEFVWTDPSPFASGVTGLLVANDVFPGSAESATAIFDNFYASDGYLNSPVIMRPTLANGNFQFAFGMGPGRTYVVESKKDLLDMVWSLITNYGPESTDSTKTPVDPLENGNKFYRVRVQDNAITTN